MEKILSEIKEAFNSISPYIQRHTSEVCPSCPAVCCINKHSYYDESDMAFICALGLEYNGCKMDRRDSEPCRFLQERLFSAALHEAIQVHMVFLRAAA